jgi:O-6-methylguanine DNA methyltransferase
MKIRYTTMTSPVGPIALAWIGETVVAVNMDEAVQRTEWGSAYSEDGPLARMEAYLARRFGAVELVRDDDAPPALAMRRYFEGDPDALDRVPVDPGGTEFQASIWEGLRRIPAGGTTTYGELAASVGRPGAARAAGGAVGGNPIPLIIPCHRVVGSDERLTGFGGGLDRKRWLLEHEGAAFRV